MNSLSLHPVHFKHCHLYSDNLKVICCSRNHTQSLLIPLLILFPLVFHPVYSTITCASDSTGSAIASVPKIFLLGTVEPLLILCLISNGKDFSKYLHQHSCREWIPQLCRHRPSSRGLVGMGGGDTPGHIILSSPRFSGGHLLKYEGFVLTKWYFSVQRNPSEVSE